MEASYLVSILSEYMPDYSRATLLAEIDYVHKLALNGANMFTRVTDPLTGSDPFLLITAEVFTIADAQKIDRVYSSDPENPHRVIISDNTIYFNPSDVGQSFYVRYYKKPADLEVETDPLLIPEDTIDILEDGVRARMAIKEHGSSEEWILWRKRSLPTLKRRLNYNYRWS